MNCSKQDLIKGGIINPIFYLKIQDSLKKALIDYKNNTDKNLKDILSKELKDLTSLKFDVNELLNLICNTKSFISDVLKNENFVNFNNEKKLAVDDIKKLIKPNNNSNLFNFDNFNDSNNDTSNHDVKIINNQRDEENIIEPLKNTETEKNEDDFLNGTNNSIKSSEEIEKENEDEELIKNYLSNIIYLTNEDFKKSINDIYFNNNVIFDQFNKYINSQIVNNIIISYKNGISGISKNNEDLNKKFQAFFNSLIKKHFGDKGLSIEGLDVKIKQVKDGGISKLLNEKLNDYYELIFLKEFNNIVNHNFNNILNIDTEGKCKYSIKSHNKNNYLDDDSVSITDEIGSLTKLIIESVLTIENPNYNKISTIIKVNPNTPLTVSTVNGIISKIGDFRTKGQSLVEAFKNYYFNNADPTFRNNLFKHGCAIITIYEYFLKEDNEKVNDYTPNTEIVSLAMMRNNEFIKEGKLNFEGQNKIYDLIECLSSKTVVQNTESLDLSEDGKYKTSVGNSNAVGSKVKAYRDAIKQCFLSNSTSKYKYVKLDGFITESGNDEIYEIRQLGSKYKLNSKPITNISTLDDNEIFKPYETESFFKFLKDSKIKLSKSEENTIQTLIENIIDHSNNQNQNDNYDSSVLHTLFVKLAERDLIQNGNYYTATNKGIDGKSNPNYSLYNLIGDDYTSFSKYDTPDGKLGYNLFVLNPGIITDTVYRTGIKLKSGEILNQKKLNTVEYATHAIQYDFFERFLKTGKVLLQPTTYSDKKGQPGKEYNLEYKVVIDGIKKELKECTNDELKFLYRKTVGGEYIRIAQNLINDYIKFFNSDYFKTINKSKKIILNKDIQSFSGETITNLDKLKLLKNYIPILSENLNLDDAFYKAGLKFQNEFHASNGKMNITIYTEVLKNVDYDYFNIQHKLNIKKFIQSMVQNQFKIKLENEIGNNNVKVNKYAQICEKFGIEYDKTWEDKDGNLILYKTKNEGELDSVYNIYNNDNDIIINPILEKYLLLHNLLNDNYTLATVGGKHGHNGKVKLNKINEDLKKQMSFYYENNKGVLEGVFSNVNEFLESEFNESGRLLAMFKRMVAYQAKIHKVPTNHILGLPLNAKFSVVKDVSKIVYNSIGDSTSVDVADGSAWIPMVTALAFNNTLGDQHNDELTFKLIRHDVDVKSNIANLDKYAAQTITNQRMRDSEFSKAPLSNINRLLMSAVNLNEVNSEGFDIFENDNLRNALFNKVTIQIENGIKILKDIQKIDGHSNYAVTYTKYEYIKDDKGNDILQESEITESHVYNTIHDIWNNLLGGLNSITKVGYKTNIQIGNTYYDLSESSQYNLFKIMNYFAIKIDGTTNQINQDSYYQPLKHAMVWQLNNVSGMKVGTTAVNPSSIYSDLSENVKLKYFTSSTSNWSIQGDFGHEYDKNHEADVTTPSQLVSLATFNGFGQEEVTKLYKSIAELIYTNSNIDLPVLSSKSKEDLGKLIFNLLRDREKLGVASDYGTELQKQIENNKDLQELNIPFSDSNFYNATITMVSGLLNKVAIKRKMPGLAAVLSQAHDIITVKENVDGSFTSISDLYSSFKFKEKSELELIRSNKSENASVEITPDKIYPHSILKLQDSNNSYVFEINDPIEYYRIKDTANNLKKLKKLLIELRPSDKQLIETLEDDLKLHDVKYGIRNLRSRYLKFKSNEDVEYNDMDLYSAKLINDYQIYLKTKTKSKRLEDYLNNKNFDIDKQGKEILKELKIYNQELLLELEKGIFILENGVIIEGKVEVIPGELILPNIYAHKFNLKPNQRISDVNDNYFNFRANIIRLNNDKDSIITKECPFYFTTNTGEKIGFVNQINNTNYKFENHDDNIKIIKGKKYFSLKGEILFEITDNLIIHKIKNENDSFEYIVEYENIKDVDIINKTQNFFSLDYNFKTDNNKNYIPSFINNYDKQNRNFYLNDKGKINYNKINKNLGLNRKIKKLQAELKASWNEYLNVLAVRIPAQSWQSLMAMKIVGFTGGTLNTTYLPIKKNYLDGSDFDIDKVFIVSKSIKNGKLITHTDFFNFSNTHDSYKLPIIRNLKYDLDSNNIITKSDAELLNSYYDYWLNNTEDSEEALILFKDVVRILNTLTDDTYKIVDNNNETIKGKEVGNLKLNRFINAYVTSFNNMSDERISEGLKNIISLSIQDLALKASNYQSGESGVEMNDLREAAEKSTAGLTANIMTSSNPFTNFIMKTENSVGGDTIGIAAVGIKVYSALTFYYNSRINELNNELITNPDNENFIKDKFIKLIKGNVILDIESPLIANFRIPEGKLLQWYHDYINDTRNRGFNILDNNRTNDASLSESGMLSAATDNAKELLLKKINADTKFAGIYMYLIIKGFDVSDIANLMTDNTLDFISKRMEGNAFINSYKPSKESILKDLIRSINKNDPTEYKSLLKNLQLIFDGAAELTILGRRFGINQGVKTSLEERLSYSLALDNFIKRKAESILAKMNLIPENKQTEDDIKKIESCEELLNFDSTRFHNENEYTQKMINHYENIKTDFNVLEVEHYNVHYTAMMASNNSLEDSFKQNIYKYDRILKLTEELKQSDEKSKPLFLPTDTYTEFDLNKISKHVNDILTYSFFKTAEINFKIKKDDLNKLKIGTLLNSSFGHSTINDNSSINFDLSTPYGKFNFINYMNNYLNSLKSYSSDSVEYNFGKHLKTEVILDPVTKSNYLKYSLNIPFENENVAISTINDAFLKFIENDNSNFLEKLTVYNLLMHQNSISKLSFTSLVYNNGNNEILTKYFKHVGKIDSNFSKIEIDSVNSINYLGMVLSKYHKIKEYDEYGNGIEPIKPKYFKNIKGDIYENEKGKIVFKSLNMPSYLYMDDVKEIVDVNNKTTSLKQSIIIPDFVKSTEGDFEIVRTLANKLSELYNFHVEYINNSDLVDLGKKFKCDLNLARGFTSVTKNTVYLNSDLASLAEPLHELSHLILPALKFKNYEAYKIMMDKVKQDPRYDDIAKSYGDLSGEDLDEEVFITIFAEYYRTLNYKKYGDDWVNNIKNLTNSLPTVLSEVFESEKINNESIIDLMKSSLSDIMESFGDSLLRGKLSFYVDYNNILVHTKKIRKLYKSLSRKGYIIKEC